MNSLHIRELNRILLPANRRKNQNFWVPVPIFPVTDCKTDTIAFFCGCIKGAEWLPKQPQREGPQAVFDTVKQPCRDRKHPLKLQGAATECATDGVVALDWRSGCAIIELWHMVPKKARLTKASFNRG